VSALTSTQARDFVARMARVRIYSGALGDEDVVLAEGNVMSYIDAPSVELMHDDGKLKSWSTRLRVEEVDPAAPETEREFAQAITRERVRRGWSQDLLVEELAKRRGLKIHQTGITRIEAGTRRVRLDEAIALARVLNIELRLGGEPS
jgi:hypothetical protein